jgi:coenzyme F420-0:L-glutamate ligase/coenzyme F420-1:gamma-L-glutamate ligase
MISNKKKNPTRTISVIGIEGLPVIKIGDNLAELICEAVARMDIEILEGDILVVTHKIVSNSEGNVVNLDQVVPSDLAKTIASKTGKDPSLVEVVLQESREIRRLGEGVIITQTKQGWVCANSGVDKSNVRGERFVVTLPKDPDESARRIRKRIRELTHKDVAVVVSDSHGRPARMGEINVAIGVSGIRPIRDRRGEKDLFGRVLRVKQTAVADEVSSAAELVIGQADEGIPVAIVRGVTYSKSEDAKANELVRPKEKDLFK